MTHAPSPLLSADERAKYTAILQLSRQQIAALEEGDFAAFQSILAAKGQLIGALRHAGWLAQSDASFAALVEQIRRSEHRAEEMLRSRLDATRSELTEFRSRKKARLIYQSADRKRVFTPATATADTPRLFDLHY